jgi:hypothetical protein
LGSLYPADILPHFQDASDNLLLCAAEALPALTQFLIDRCTKKGAPTGIASQLRSERNSFNLWLKSVGWFVSASAVPPPSKGMKRGFWDTTGTKKEGVRRVADEDVEVADE